MKSKSVLYALAVIVLTGGMAVAAFAEAPVASLSADPEQGLSPWGAGEIREPVETGAVPDRVEGSSDLFQAGYRARSRRWRSGDRCTARASIPVRNLATKPVEIA